MVKFCQKLNNVENYSCLVRIKVSMNKIQVYFYKIIKNKNKNSVITVTCKYFCNDNIYIHKHTYNI